MSQAVKIDLWNLPQIFTFVDDSNEKLTLETFTVLFIFLSVGLLLSPVALVVEKWIYKKQEMKRMTRKMAQKKNRIAP